MKILPTVPATSPCKYLILLSNPSDDSAAYTDLLKGHAADILLAALAKADIALSECCIHSTFPYINKNPNWSTYFSRGSILRPDIPDPLVTVRKLIKDNAPTLVIPLGPFALWAMTSSTKINDYRGFLRRGIDDTWVLPSVSPHTILKDYSLRAFLIRDLMKAKRYIDNGLGPNYSFTPRTVMVAQTPDEAGTLLREARNYPLVAVDIETFMDLQQISTISFSPTPELSYVIPLLSRHNELYSPEAEQAFWGHIFDFLTDTSVDKLFHNAVFDLSHLWAMHIPALGKIHDSMVASHSSQLELPKSLSVLGSFVCDVPAWKNMRTRTKDQEKVDE